MTARTGESSQQRERQLRRRCGAASTTRPRALQEQLSSSCLAPAWERAPAASVRLARPSEAARGDLSSAPLPARLPRTSDSSRSRSRRPQPERGGAQRCRLLASHGGPAAAGVSAAPPSAPFFGPGVPQLPAPRRNSLLSRW